MSKPVNMAPVQWFGGKGNLKHKLLPMIPYANSYVEPFGGGGSILFARRPSPIEMYNDLDGRLVNLFRVLQNREQREALQDRLKYTLYSREEMRLAVSLFDSSDPIERAWAFFVAYNMCYSSDKNARGWSYDVTTGTENAQPPLKFRRKIDAIDTFYDRLRYVQIDSRDAKDVIESMDTINSVFYIDPPYVPEARKYGEYRHEMDNADHERLISQLLTVQGAVVLSGYEHPIYEPLTENDWELTRINWHTSFESGDGEKKPRVECVWRNPRCLQMLNKTSLF